MPLKPSALTLLLSLAVLPAHAQEQMTPDGFLDLARGRTLTFTSILSGTEIGVEQFLRRDLSVWADRTGRCTYGRIEIHGPLLCFLYEDVPDPKNWDQLIAVTPNVPPSFDVQTQPESAYVDPCSTKQNAPGTSSQASISVALLQAPASDT